MVANPRNELSTQLAQALRNKEVQSCEKREITVTFRVSESEKIWLEQRCQGIIQSDYIRAKLFDCSLPKPKKAIPEINRQMICELKRLGNNLNQQTRDIKALLKTRRALGSTWDYLITLKELTSLVGQCIKEIVQLSECDDDS